MVVVSDKWANNVSFFLTDESQDNDDMVTMPEEEPVGNGTATAILECRPNSHPFRNRKLVLDRPAKIGRSVAKSKPMVNNAIFDCKVLSRHHAYLWYEGGSFYLKDTQSSNGTFVNNNRLNADTKQYEVKSGDIVQFGVDVLENNNQVTHGCIIAMLMLYLPDGREAKSSKSESGITETAAIPIDELYHLNHILQEANQREQCLESKLTALQDAVDETRREADLGWKAYVGEELLLSRVSTLETQLQQAHKNLGEDALREELEKLQENSLLYQEVAKESLERLLGKRLEALDLVESKERARLNAEEEAALTKKELQQVQVALERLALKYSVDQVAAAEENKRLEQREQELMAELNKKIEENKKMMKYCGTLFNDLEKGNENNHRNSDDPKKIDDEELISNHLDSSKPEDTTDPPPLITEPESLKKKVDFDLGPESEESRTDSSSPELLKEQEDSLEKEDYAKTLKCQLATIQSELRKKCEALEATSLESERKIVDLEQALIEANEIKARRSEENEELRREMALLKEKFCEGAEPELRSRLSYEQIVNLEEELVLLKERFAQVGDEKLRLQKDLISLKEDYHLACNRSSNKAFFYFAPLVLMVLYLLISAMIS